MVSLDTLRQHVIGRIIIGFVNCKGATEVIMLQKVMEVQFGQKVVTTVNKLFIQLL